MKRRTLIKSAVSAALLQLLPLKVRANQLFRRVRPRDAAWPSNADWQRLNTAVGGNLLSVDFPIAKLQVNPSGKAAQALLDDLKDPWYIDDEPGLTQNSGWVDAWQSRPSVYAVAARNANDIAAAVNFARENKLRLAVKGGAHSYQGTCCAPDSLLIWTRHLTDINLHDAFVPRGCEGKVAPQPAVTLGAGTAWVHAYEKVTTQSGRYVQGGGCATVGVPGLIQSGGFGSLSKHYGIAAAGLLEAEVITADGEIRIANACTDPDLFWALKGGGGGTFGVVSHVTLRTHALPEYFGIATFNVKAKSNDAYRRLIHAFIAFYRERLFNDHWGEQVHFRPDNQLSITMLAHDVSPTEAKATFAPFLDAVAHDDDWSTSGQVLTSAVPARHFWDIDWWKVHWPEIAFPRNGNPLHALLDDILVHVMNQPVFDTDSRPGAPAANIYGKGDGKQTGQYLWAYESLWVPARLLEGNALADALYEGSRHAGIALHCNKGMAGGTPEAVSGARDTAMNPAVVEAFALAICAGGQGFAYPGIAGHEPSVKKARAARQRVRDAMQQLRAATGKTGSYVSESNYFEPDWQRSYWGANYARLAAIKAKYDPTGLFTVHNGVGSEGWSDDGFVRTSS